jgi:hypothetical protein
LCTATLGLGMSGGSDCQRVLRAPGVPVSLMMSLLALCTGLGAAGTSVVAALHTESVAWLGQPFLLQLAVHWMHGQL